MTADEWTAVEAAFHGARERAAEDREAFLERTCPDPSLRHHVRALLAQEDGALLREGLPGAVAAMAGSEVSADREGQRLGAYVLGPRLGAGAMGEVYRARDVALGRDVAIKLLPEELREPRRVARFRREARILAALEHPNIAAIHGLVEGDGPPALVLEFVDGPTLAEVVARSVQALSHLPGGGAMPVAEALDVAVQVAAALEAAHRLGIVHRDLKPANVAITADRVVKVLDFGLAFVAAASHVDPLPPLETTHGTILGTVAYMSPEQTRGQAIDHRADIWAFGAVLYEMLCGVRPFLGATTADVLAAIITSEPDWTRVPRGTPESVVALLRQCLTKDPAWRLHDIADARIVLGDAGTRHRAGAALDAAGPERAGRGGRFGRSSWVASAAMLIGVGGVAAGLVAVLRPVPPAARSGIIRATIPVVESIRVAEGGVAISPDGRTIVYEGRVGAERPRLYRRAIDGDTSEPIPGTERGHAPFFSPDGRWVGFAAGQQLKKVPLSGGSPVVICEVQSHFGASWADDGTIVVSLAPESGLFRVPDTGGTPTPLTTLSPADTGNDHRWPVALPGGRGVIFAVATGPAEDARVVVLDARTGARRDLIHGAASARLVGTQHLAYAIGGNLYLVPFDLDRLEVSGTPRVVARGVAEYTDGAPEYAFSAAGDLVYVPGRAGGDRHRLVLVDLAGQVTPLAAPPDFIQFPRISADGTTIAYMVAGAKNNVWTYDMDRGVAARATAGRFHYPVWTPDGRLSMADGGLGAQRIVLHDTAGRGFIEPLVEPSQEQAPEAWSPDGRTLFYRVMQPDTTWHLWSYHAPTRTRAPFLATRVDTHSMRPSPDGRWALYNSREGGLMQLHLRSLRPDAGRTQISDGGADVGAWSPDGRRIYYRGLPGSDRDGLWVVDVRPQGSSVAAGRPRRLFGADAFEPSFDVTPDGRHFVMVQRDPTPPPRELRLVLDAATGGR